jgi:four helix bundle protein
MSNTPKFDLIERTSSFGEKVIDFAKIIPRNPVTFPLISQFIRSGTSVGANYFEADHAESRKDFEHKLGICKKEANETKYWIRIIVRAEPSIKSQAVILWREADELRRIFSAIVNTSRTHEQDRNSTFDISH